MARIDIPTMQCDRCKIITSDLNEMGNFFKLSHSHLAGYDEWDLCPSCRDLFKKFMKEHDEQS